MKTLSKYMLATLILASVDCFGGKLSSGQITLTPLSGPSQVDQSQVRAGIDLLFKDSTNCSESLGQTCPSSDQADLLFLEAMKFQRDIHESWNQYVEKTNGQVPYTVQTTSEYKGTIVRQEISFESPIQRAFGHPANTVRANLFMPRNIYNCDVTFPVSIVIHHIQDDVEAIHDLGRGLAMKETIGNGSATLVIQLPHYGLRKKQGEEFLTPDMNAFRKNLIQMILDIHVLRDWVHTQPLLDQQRISLLGISLGGVLSHLVASMDPGFTAGYGSLVGGGDFANILMNRVRTRPNSEVEQALRGTQLTESALRLKLAPFDPLLWAHRIQNSRIMMLNAKGDDIVDMKKSVDKLKNIYLSNNNKLTEHLLDGGHTPTGSFWSKLTRVVLPIDQFVRWDAPIRSTSMCERNF